MRSFRIAVVWTALCCLGVAAQAQDYNDLLLEAAAAYDQGAYTASGELYERAFAAGFPTGDHLYLTGRSFARAGDPDKAFRYFNLLFDRGSTTLYAFMMRDPTLEPLHGDPRWDAITARVDQLLKQTHPDLNVELRRALLAMAEQDQELRTADADLRRTHGADSPQADSVVTLIIAADRAHQRELTAIIDRHGWPGRRIVGDDGAQAAWLIVQHAPLEFQERMVPLLRRAVELEEANKADLAYLEDRILVRKGLPQVYGTQLCRDETGIWDVPCPIRDEINVDQRRAAVGLEPLSTYLERLGIGYEGIDE